MAFMPPCRMGPPLRSSAADAHSCIMVQILWIYRIQVRGAMLRANWRAPLRSSHANCRVRVDRLACDPTPSTERPGSSAVPKSALDINIPIQVVGHGTGTPLLHRQARLGTIERLDLALLIDRQHTRALSGGLT